MGSYAECWLDSLYVGSTKNDIDYGLMQLFRASDKRQVRTAVKDLPRPMRHWAEYLEDLDEEVDVVYYSVPAVIVKDRLELMGYTLATAKAAFTKRIRFEAKEYAEYAAREIGDAASVTGDYYKVRTKLLESLDVDHWLTTLLHIKECGLGRIEARNSDSGSEGTLEAFMLKNDWYGFSGIDVNVPLRLALETCSEKDNFVYDLTELVSGGDFDQDVDFVAVAAGFAAAEHASHSKIIILTEGRSDGWIISKSMKLLYPHLSDYFTFMDFEAARVEGGVSHLAKIVKSFAGAGIVNKVIAVFDNDTAGEEAIRILREIQLPGNLRAMKLPPLEALRNYPTIGPSGPTMMDVNGLAASIELYLGTDVLTEVSKLMDIQWTDFNSTLGKYQGEVLHKDRIHKRFKEKLRAHEACPELVSAMDWSGMRTILTAIFSAFHNFDRDSIFAEKMEEYTRA